MKSRSTIYQDQQKTYTIDSTRPQRQAIAAGKVRLMALAHAGYPGHRIPAKALSGVSTLGIMNVTQDQDWGTEWHRNEGVEIGYLESGRMPLQLEGSEYMMHSGDLSITRPWQLHRLGNPNITAGRLSYVIFDVGVRRPDQTWNWPSWVILAPKDQLELTDILRHAGVPVFSCDKRIRQCFQEIGRLIEQYKHGNHFSHLAIQLNFLLVLLLEVLREHRIPLDRTLSGRRHTVELFLQDLKRNPDSLREPWRVETMARRCGVSPSTFQSYCKEITNVPPMVFLNRSRAEYAARLLRSNPELSVTDIAFAAGFNTSQYFAMIFRKFLRCSPRYYRVAEGEPAK